MTTRSVRLYTPCHDSCGEPSTKRCTEAEAGAIEAGDAFTCARLKEADPTFSYSKWDLRSNWVRVDAVLAAVEVA